MHRLALFALAAVLGSASVSTASAQTRFATVDIRKVFESYSKAREVDRQIHEQRTQVKKELEDRLEVFNKAVSEMQKLDAEIKRPELSAVIRGAKAQERAQKVSRLTVMQKEGNELRETREKELQDLAMRTRNSIIDDIKRVVTERAKSDQYDVVFDRSGSTLTGFPVLVYVKESYDITDDVVTTLNKTKGATEAAKPTDPRRPAATPKKPK